MPSIAYAEFVNAEFAYAKYAYAEFAYAEFAYVKYAALWQREYNTVYCNVNRGPCITPGLYFSHLRKREYYNS